MSKQIQCSRCGEFVTKKDLTTVDLHKFKKTDELKIPEGIGSREICDRCVEKLWELTEYFFESKADDVPLMILNELRFMNYQNQKVLTGIKDGMYEMAMDDKKIKKEVRSILRENLKDLYKVL